MSIYNNFNSSIGSSKYFPQLPIPDSVTGVTLIKSGNFNVLVRWTPTQINGVDCDVLVFFRGNHSNANYALSNAIESDIINTTFSANTTYPTVASQKSDINGGNGQVVLLGQGTQNGTLREVLVETNILINRTHFSVGIYSYNGDINNPNPATISFNINQASATARLR